MYAIAFVIVGLLVAVVWIAVVSDPPSKVGRNVATGLTLLALILIGLLVFARPQVCTSLGGEWIQSEHVCRDDLGGNPWTSN
jgi:hypothetical protein